VPYDPDNLRLLRRRELLSWAGASTLAGVGCFDRPREKIVPYVRQPLDVTPGRSQHYATSFVVDGLATGLIAESREGRPIKLEGNPDHPASAGGTRAIDQASLLGLYDPSRSRGVLRDGRPASWRALLQRLAPAAQRGLRLVLPPQSSPLHGALLESIAARHPDAAFCLHAPVGGLHGLEEASRAIFGAPRAVQHDFRRAEVVVALDADFMATGAMSCRWARDFAARRRLGAPGDAMGRFYAVEPMPTPTGTLADHHHAVRAVDVPRVAAALAAEIDPRAPAALGVVAGSLASPLRAAVRVMARDLKRHPGRSVVIAGDQQPAATHALALLVNAALGNLGQTVWLTESPLLAPTRRQRLDELFDDLRSGRADAIVVIEANPVYDAAPDLAELLRHARFSAHLSLHRDETSAACQWHLPASHYLESWGEARAYDGTLSFVQPLVAPLYATRSATAILAALAGRPESDHEILLAERRRASRSEGDSFERAWERELQRGYVPDSAFAAIDERPQWDAARPLLKDALAPADGLEIHFEISPQLYDGRFATNGWLQELPHPLTKITWGNAAVMSPARAAALGVSRGDVVELAVGSSRLRLPAYPLPGHADDSFTVALGYGRHVEGVAEGVGASAFSLRGDHRHGRTGLEVTRTGERLDLAITQDHGEQQGRELALVFDHAAYARDPDLTEPHRRPLPTLLPLLLDDAVGQWAMTIDTMICTGCSACVLACQAENNVPVVGPEAVRRGREMHWLRIDRYFVSPADGPPGVVHQPMACQHCEKAPCEYVCPVNATVHSPDGLNEMVYNRCVGTRFCSNNCPYKVRRFNWLDYETPEPLSLQHNPEVTVRDRGVMEKCTYCVQRIRQTERRARLAGRPVEPDEVVTACGQACPTGAISFGLLQHREGEMARRRREPRAYAVLHGLGARPRTQYLAKIVNPNPEIA
jgi:Fe-S-cluster-containing dehydrogenase component/anaerobic selenocysteine-containing dehydrogenase